MTPSHPLLERLLKRTGASLDEAPSLDAWRQLCELVSRTYREADQDRYRIERAMEVSSQEMQELYQELRRRADHELALVRDSDERHRMLFEANPLPMWVVDLETLRFVDVNTAMVTTYGYAREELLGMHASRLKLPEDVPSMVQAMRERAIDAIEHIGARRHVRKDGQIVEMDITSHQVAIGGRPCIVAIALDITQARRTEEELRQAQKMEAVGRLAGGIAHDFNNILAVVLSNVEYALDGAGLGPETVEALGEIHTAATRAAGLTRQLLQFSRKQKRQLKPIALNALVTGVEAMLERIVGEDIAMSATIARDLGTIEADPGEVEQVIMNLVINARDAMPAGGQLLLETANTVLQPSDAAEVGVAPGPYVVLAVTDTGCGMTEAVRLRIFEPFFTTKDVDKGTGLGLATVFGIVKASRGGIAVRSEPGRGATFRIYWPRTDAAVTPTVETRFVPIRGAGTVLLVEDDAQLRKILHLYLTSWGFSLLEAANGVAALELVREHRGTIDLLLTDMVMPGGIDGRTLGQRLRVDRPETRIVFMSGYTEHPALDTELGPYDVFVQKPFTLQALSEALRRVLGDHATGRVAYGQGG